MSLVVFESEPQLYTPSDNPITWVLSYPTAGTFNLFFELVVYINGEGVSTLRLTPERSDNTNYYAHVDVSNIVKTYVEKANVDQSTIVIDANNYKQVQIIALVYYSTTLTGTVAFDIATLAGSSTIYAFKGCLSKKEFVSWDYTNYVPTASTKKYLTENTDIVELREKDETFLQIITNSLPVLLIIDLYNSSGSVINSHVESLSSNVISQLKFSTTLLKTIFTPTEVNNTVYFNVSIKNLSYAFRSETKRININRAGCYRGKNLTWLNKFGAYDTFLFTYNAIYKADVQSKSYGKQFGTWDGVDYIYTNTNSGNLTYLKTITEKVQVVSDWLTQSQQNWLVYIYESPLIYINEGVVYENIDIENSSYAVKQSEHEELFNEIIDCKFSNTKNSVLI